MKISSENFIAEISIDLDNPSTWSGMGKLDKMIYPGTYETNIGKMLILNVREDLTFSFVITEKAITWANE